MKPYCRWCGKQPPVRLRLRINSNGSVSVFWFCIECRKGAQKGEPAISHEEAQHILDPHGVYVDNLEVVVDYRTDKHPCLICGDTDTEYNHWMPQMFRKREDVWPDWGEWNSTGSFLCRKHHTIWHTHVTPYMRQGNGGSDEL